MGNFRVTKADIEFMTYFRDVYGLISALSYEYWPIRERAARALGKIKDKTAVEPLIQALRDENPRVKLSAIRALGRIGDPSAIESLTQTLRDEDGYVRYLAARALGNIRDERVVGPLLQALKDENKRVRDTAIRALDRLRRWGWRPRNDVEKAYYLIGKREWDELVEMGRPVVEPLIEALKDSDSDVRENAAQALGKIGDVWAVEPLIEALNDEEWYVRWKSAEALGKIGDVRAVEPLLSILKHGDSDIRWSAAWPLAMIGDARAVEPLIQALNDTGLSVRKSVTWALGLMGDARAVEPLIQVLNDWDKTIRGYAAASLGKIRDARAVEPLIKALNDVHEYVRGNAAWALGEIGDTRAVEPLTEALKDESSYVREYAIGSLEKLKVKDVGIAESLIQALKNECFRTRLLRYQKYPTDDRHKEKIVQALVDLGEPAVEPLIQALKDEDSSVRLCTAEALERMGWQPKHSIERILYLIGKQRWVQVAIIGEDALEPLIHALNDKTWFIRSGAAIALGMIGDMRAVEHLIQTLRDKHNHVRLRAAEALERMGWQPKNDVEKAYHLIGKRDWSKLEEMGAPAVDPIEQTLKDEKDYSIQKAMEKALKRIWSKTQND